MGTEITRADGQNSRPAIKAVGTERTSSESTSSTDTEKGTTTSGNRRSGRGDGETKTEKELSRLVDVDEEQKKKDERNARRRERYAQKKAEQGKTVKPKKVNGSKKTQQAEIGTATQISALIGTVSAIVASRPNCAHWQLTPAELESLSTPISNMLSKSDAMNTLAEHSDAIALVTACATVILPRAVISIHQGKERKKLETKGVKTDTKRQQTHDKGRKDNSTSRTHDGGNAPTSANDNQNEHWIGASLFE